ncbi:DNA topoisomerase I [Candidatus Bathyarchaeota archaeon]|nr:DNA topoisomerase I [Candidatus Bathyarchaeota archaeon]
MRTTLIICEKPDAALHVAEALSENGEVKKLMKHGIPYFEVNNKSEKLIVCSAIGHLYEVDVKGDGKRSEYPVWDFSWKPKHLVERGQKRQEKCIKAITELAEEADFFINACDYDIEGSLIGYMILKYACKGAEAKARRMKFSTLTIKELREAYRNLMSTLDYPLIKAGMCRHEVDWLYGVNLSRALTESARKYSGKYSTLSIGRVQGPTLKFIVEREKEVQTFVPKPYWIIKSIVNLNGEKFEAEYKISKIEEKKIADEVAESCFKKEGEIINVQSKEYKLLPPTPFDLTQLQLEAYRYFKFTPKQTLDIAERLYLNALISYPRTSSQKLPSTIGYQEILNSLKENSEYKNMVDELYAIKELKPNEGKKTDPAHPAIYPTGVQPKEELSIREKKIYDLIVKRFMATFGASCLKKSEKATIKVSNHIFYLKGSRILKPGWMKLYAPYSSLEENLLPPIFIGQKVFFEEVKPELKYTQPPSRFNPTSLLKLMEEQGIGTKATRAEIIDILYKRGYVKDERIVATPLSFKIINLMLKYCPKVVSIEFTRELEEMMRKIEFGEEEREKVVLEAVNYLKPAIMELKLKENEIGEELSKVIKQVKALEFMIKTPCPSCGSQLLIIKSRKTGKRFIGCSGLWSNKCHFSLPLPQKGKLSLLDKTCSECGFQMIQVKISGRRPMISCPKCFINRLRNNKS